MHKTSLLIILLSGLLFAQEISWINLIIDKVNKPIPSYNYEGKVYISLPHLSESLNLDYDSSIEENIGEIKLDQVRLRFTARNPFVTVEFDSTGETKTVQLPVSSHYIDGQIFAPIDATIELFNKYGNTSIFNVSPGKLMVLEREQTEKNRLNEIKIEESKQGTYIF